MSRTGSAQRSNLHATRSHASHSGARPALLPVSHHDYVRLSVPSRGGSPDRTPQCGLCSRQGGNSSTPTAYEAATKASSTRMPSSAIISRHAIPKGLNVGPKRVKIRPITLEFYQSRPFDAITFCRNTLYFTLYDLAEGRLAMMRELWRVRSRSGRSVIERIAWQTALFTMNLCCGRTPRAQIRACLLGIWHGDGNITARYYVMRV